MIATAMIVIAAVVTLYVIGYEATRYVFWWRYHDRFAWWQTWREERGRDAER